MPKVEVRGRAGQIRIHQTMNPEMGIEAATSSRLRHFGLRPSFPHEITL
jgi:hypothetical protein